MKPCFFRFNPTVVADDAFLVVVTGVLTVGNIFNNDIYRVIDVQFVPLSYEVPLSLDPRLIDVSF